MEILYTDLYVGVSFSFMRLSLKLLGWTVQQDFQDTGDHDHMMSMTLVCGKEAVVEASTQAHLQISELPRDKNGC